MSILNWSTFFFLCCEKHINMQVSIAEEQKQEPTLKMDDESKTNDGNPSLHSSQPDGSDSKPDMNDVAMEDVQVGILFHIQYLFSIFSALKFVFCSCLI